MVGEGKRYAGPRRAARAPCPGASLSACGPAPVGFYWPFTMISPETFSHIDNIKKRAGHLWRFL
jgi:hypothetical protein